MNFNSGGSATGQNILNFLWEWAEGNGNWAKYLVSLVLRNYDYPDPEEIKQVYNVFLNSFGLLESSPISEITRPIFSSEKKHLQLLSLDSVSGVNRLSAGQALHFAENMTVIYGENGTGKTGYGRILKSMGICYEKETNILPNVYVADNVEQTARIMLKIDGVTHECAWRNGNLYEDLQNISCFTNDCVKISLTPKRELLVTPLGFHLFSIISAELDALSHIHSVHIDSLKTTVDILPTLNEGSQVHKFLSTLTEESSLETLSALSSISESEIELLEKKEKELLLLNRTLLTTEIAILTKQIAEIENLLSRVTLNQKIKISEIKDGIILLFKEIEKLKNYEAKGIQDIAQKRGIQFYDSPEFTTFLNAAEKYIERLGNDYPKEGDLCIYCRQPLTESDSVELVKLYRQLLSDTTQADLKALNDNIELTLAPIKELKEDLFLHQSSFGEEEDGTAHQPDMLKAYSKKITEIKKSIPSRDIAAIASLDICLEDDAVISFLKTKLEDLNSAKTLRSTSLTDIEGKELQLKKEIAELKDRIILALLNFKWVVPHRG